MKTRPNLHRLFVTCALGLAVLGFFGCSTAGGIASDIGLAGAGGVLLEYYQALPKEQLVRKLILGKMQRAGYANQSNQEIIAWVEENPDIKAKIEARVKNVPEANRQRAFITAAKSEAMNGTVKSSQGVRT